jgi:hypothetical protein
LDVLLRKNDARKLWEAIRGERERNGKKLRLTGNMGETTTGGCLIDKWKREISIWGPLYAQGDQKAFTHLMITVQKTRKKHFKQFRSLIMIT